MEKEGTGKRNIPLEWLRIVSMLMIILLHSIDHSGVLENLTPGSALYYWEEFLYAMVQVCVNCFVLISGYFLVTSKFRPGKLLSLWAEVVFYGFFIKLIVMIGGGITFSLPSLLSCFLPVLTGRYWFVTIYFGLYLIAPFLNIGLRAMTKRQHQALLAVLFVLFSVMVSVWPGFAGMNSGGGWGLAWFAVLYVFAAYLRLHYTPPGKSGRFVLIFFACPVIMTVTLWAAQTLGLSALERIAANWQRYDSVFAFAATLALMLAFLNWKGTESETVNRAVVRLSSATFGVYLIHNHANLCTEANWQALGMVSFTGYLWYPVYQLALVLAIFFVCAGIDFLRQMLFRGLRIERKAEQAEIRFRAAACRIGRAAMTKLNG